MNKSILIVHPDNSIRKLLSHIIRNSCSSILVKHGWQDLPIKEASSIKDSIVSKDAHELLIAHIDGVDPNTEDVASVRQFRFDGACTSLIALSFTYRNAHRVFHEKAHALLIYPFKLDALRDVLKNIMPIEPKALKGFRERVFSDPEYLKTLFGIINHAVSHKDWEQINLNIIRMEKCFGDKIASEKLVKLLKNKECNVKAWQAVTDQIWREYGTV